MKPYKKSAITLISCVFFACLPAIVSAQNQVTVLAGAELTKVTPTGFYFQGQSAPTQMRNAAAARAGNDRFVIAGLVDTSGYAAEIRAKYEGFLITDSPVSVGGWDLSVGAYGFGFTNDGKFTILDVAGNQIASVASAKDNGLKRPRPLMMQKSGSEVRLYRGKDYVAITFK